MGALVSLILVLAVTLVVCVCVCVCVFKYACTRVYGYVCKYVNIHVVGSNLRRHALRSVYLGLETRKSDLDQRHTYKATAAPQQALGLPISASSPLEF